MPSGNEMSKGTWREIDKLLHEIMRRAASTSDNEIYRKADRCTALLRNLSTEIEIENRSDSERT
jgi:hypothetical protein